MPYQANLREAWGQALLELARKKPAVVALEADLGKSTRSILMKAELPERYFEMGIAEQNMASTAAGLALAGKMPFIHSFAVFASGRAYDQLRNSICIPNLDVRVCGSSAGLSDFGDGKTHQAVEDVAIMRALPNMTVLCPVDGIETALMVEALGRHHGPAYVRINRNDLPFLYPPEEPYRIGKVLQLRDGDRAVVFACGVMVSRALQAAERLAASGIPTRVVNVSTLKPLDREAIIRHAAGMQAIVTAEEHSVIGGLGSAVLEALRRERHAPLEMVGIPDSFGVSASDYESLLGRFGLTAAAIEKAARGLLEGRA
ncbi:MAG TPA: transketolase C-terminal domain-containing protein [Spirochaetia bacterium]|nr:transketolase C-terminal domain-containing protein [Spirochaetia bacterium]